MRSSSSRKSSRWTRAWSQPSALPIFLAASRLQSSDQHAPSATGTRRRRISPRVTAASCATASTASATRWQLCWQSGSRRRSSSDAACAMARAWRPCHSAIASAQPSGILALQATSTRPLPNGGFNVFFTGRRGKHVDRFRNVNAELAHNVARQACCRGQFAADHGDQPRSAFIGVVMQKMLARYR